MRLRYISAFITLIAGTITCIISIVRHADTLKSLKTLLFVLILFYVIGLIAQKIIMHVLKPNNKELESDVESGTKSDVELDHNELKSDNNDSDNLSEHREELESRIKDDSSLEENSNSLDE